MLPDEHVGHVGHEDIAPAVAELLQGKHLLDPQSFKDFVRETNWPI